ncbi:MAG: 4-hydroxy-3-methylbut-2-enyl diphosphate reductase [Acidobacteriia bacterium]|nr:4-hydroxy-3-methylbut-2-enyl diphosphate reductase [Terriglobia bacterium]MYG04776.1 4-hydroxy-3-methylbut-2-enyl diphosphate reductase [Terriglobia bacterium]MYK08564.1 4-hydroxy-3-methylbut-2-enyl diphosphate reductase [Terriglobia bacterium]
MTSVSDRSVLLLKPRGFCAGVVRAIDIVELALQAYGPPIYVRKEIVHNRNVVRELASRGAVFVDSVDEVPSGARLVFSAHGVAPSVRAVAAARNLRVIDATCPLVTKVHLEAIRFAKAHCTILLVGHRDHCEVIGTVGEAPAQTIVVSSPEEAESVQVPPGSVAYLTQTTLSLDEANSIIDVLKRRFPSIQAPPAKDICYATENRQMAVKEIVRNADLLLVVGSQNSSNSRRMVEVGQQRGLPGYLIDDESEIVWAWLENARNVAVSAGASAPESLVQRVVRRLNSMGFKRVVEVEAIEENVHFPLPPELQGVQPLTQISASP